MVLKSDVVVLGAGAVGAPAALHLQARGRSVTIVDRHDGAARETSYGNAGIVQAEAVFPYTFPRNPLEILNAALNRDPRVNIQYSALPSIAPFVFKYFMASAPAARLKSARGLQALVAKCVEEHLALATPAGARDLLRDGGWIKVFRSAKGRDGGLRDAEETAPYGVNFQPLSREKLLELEPHEGDAAIGGVHFSDPLSTSDPQALISAYADLFRRRGGAFVKGDATSLRASGQNWLVTTEAGEIEARDVVLALGPWTDPLARSFGYRFPMGVKRGYHMHYAPRGNQGLSRPVLDLEKGYLVTPMAKGLRLTTGAEFSRAEDPPSNAHLDRLEPFGREMFPLGDRLESAPWLGRRPCLPDMLPIIDRARSHKGLWFDFGHHHLGLTLGPVSGRLLAEMITGEPTCVDPAPYSAERF